MNEENPRILGPRDVKTTSISGYAVKEGRDKCCTRSLF